MNITVTEENTKDFNSAIKNILAYISARVDELSKKVANELQTTAIIQALQSLTSSIQALVRKCTITNNLIIGSNTVGPTDVQPFQQGPIDTSPLVPQTVTTVSARTRTLTASEDNLLKSMNINLRQFLKNCQDTVEQVMANIDTLSIVETDLTFIITELSRIVGALDMIQTTCQQVVVDLTHTDPSVLETIDKELGDVSIDTESVIVNKLPEVVPWVPPKPPTPDPLPLPDLATNAIVQRLDASAGIQNLTWTFTANDGQTKSIALAEYMPVEIFDNLYYDNSEVYGGLFKMILPLKFDINTIGTRGRAIFFIGINSLYTGVNWIPCRKDGDYTFADFSQATAGTTPVHDGLTVMFPGIIDAQAWMKNNDQYQVRNAKQWNVGIAFGTVLAAGFLDVEDDTWYYASLPFATDDYFGNLGLEILNYNNASRLEGRFDGGSTNSIGDVALSSRGAQDSNYIKQNLQHKDYWL